MPTGASACWVTLSSLQLIRSAIQKNAEIVTYNLHTAQIYQYAKQKVRTATKWCLETFFPLSFFVKLYVISKYFMPRVVIV